MGGWWLSEALDNPVLAVSWIVWVVISIVLHELAHGWVAIRCGDDIPLHSGHMTWNPFVHIPPMAWVLFVLFGFTYGLMPTNPSNYRGRYDEAKVAFAGPLMNLLLAIVCIVLDVLWLKFGVVAGEPFHPNLHTFLWFGVVINLMGFVFNLVPVPPLDGSRVLGNLVPGFAKLWTGTAGGIAGMVAFVVLFSMSSRIWDIAFQGAAFPTILGAEMLGAPFLNPWTGKPMSP